MAYKYVERLKETAFIKFICSPSKKSLCMTDVYSVYAKNFNYTQMNMSTEDYARSVHQSICIMTIRLYHKSH
jgi:hypothetical protein